MPHRPSKAHRLIVALLWVLGTTVGIVALGYLYYQKVDAFARADDDLLRARDAMLAAQEKREAGLLKPPDTPSVPSASRSTGSASDAETTPDSNPAPAYTPLPLPSVAPQNLPTPMAPPPPSAPAESATPPPAPPATP